MFELMINKKGEYCKKHRGGGRPLVIQDDKVILELKKTLGISFSEAETMLNEAKNSAQEEYQQQASDEVSIEDLILESKIFDRFVKVMNTVTSSTSVYYDKDVNGKDFVSTLVDFDAETIENYLCTKQSGFLKGISEKLKKAINPKKPISNKDMLEYCINVLDPRETMPTIQIKDDPHPVTVQGTDVFSVQTIPFTKKDVTLGDLNPFLAEFLGRVDSHEYLCAVLWTNLIGLKTSNVIYLHGDGGDGKSGFVEMLKNLVNGSYAPFDMERFNGYNMFGKSLLVLNENNSVNIMQNKIVKEVSGGDSIKIEGKGRDAFTGVIRGQIIITSNNQPRIQGEEYETRRLRYHKVKRHTVDRKNILLPGAYQKEITSTPNEFLNYCRQCYEKHKTFANDVDIPEGYDELLSSLIDQETAEINEKIMIKISDSFELDKEGKVNTIDIIKIAKEIDKTKFVVSNLETYLKKEYGIRKEGKFFLGLRRK